MNNLQQILEMWKTDSIIDEMNLDETSRDSAKLHGKPRTSFSKSYEAQKSRT